MVANKKQVQWPCLVHITELLRLSFHEQLGVDHLMSGFCSGVCDHDADVSLSHRTKPEQAKEDKASRELFGRSFNSMVKSMRCHKTFWILKHWTFLDTELKNSLVSQTDAQNYILV